MVDVQNPKWWTKYNKLKHERTSIDPDTNKPYYKSANQINVIMSLAALYIANSYVIILLTKEAPPDELKMLLELKNCKSNLYDTFLIGSKR